MKEFGVGCLLVYVLGFGAGVIWALSGPGEGYTGAVRAVEVEAGDEVGGIRVEVGKFTRSGRNDRQGMRYDINPLEGRTEQDARD